MPTTDNKDPHYTAILEVVKVTPEHQAVTINRSNFSNDSEKVERKTEEVVRLVLRAKTLEALTTKLTHHVDLIEEDD